MQTHQDEEHRRYAQTAEGTIIEIVESRSGAAVLPEGVQELTEAEWATARTAWEASVGEHVAELEGADHARHEAAYDALLAAGLPEGVARDLSGLRDQPVQ